MNKLFLKDGRMVMAVILDDSHLPAMLELQDRVIGALANPGFLQSLTIPEFEWILRGKGRVLGAFSEDGQLIAFRAMLVPPIDEEHLGRDVGISEEELPAILYSEISAVDPAFRGNGLQQLLGKQLFEETDLSNHRYICTTVAPYNIASLKDKFALGMHVAALKVKYGEKLRYIMLRDMSATGSKSFTQSKDVEMIETEAQQKLLAEGWIGTRMYQAEGKWFVKYQK